jgi:hypothetical protein
LNPSQCHRDGDERSADQQWFSRGPFSLLLIVWAVFGWANSLANAGGGPENVLLLVNANSDSSKTIANHYIKLRQIPPSNVLYVNWRGALDTCSGKNFRDLILRPTLKAIEDRSLSAQIDYIVYSSDFPWRVNLQPLFPEEQFRPEFRPLGSLTGMTYLAPYVTGEKPNPALIMPTVNWYVPGMKDANLGRCAEIGETPSRGFRFWYLWDRNGERTEKQEEGQRYILSTMLGITQGRGNTVSEVLAYLERSASADGKRPRGTIYFAKNNDVRSEVRHDCYAAAAVAIQRLGVAARVIDGKIPSRAPDVMGIMAGAADFDVAAARNNILPGAICEHLTSTGGVMSADGYQTPLSEFLRAGATAASGTVIEPRAMQAKFPLPSLQLHYARGCSVAESFYQSVASPYQLLIVGDPLCQPWAVFPDVTLEGLKPHQVVQGEVKLIPSGTAAAGRQIGLFEVFVDGRLVARLPPGQGLTLNTTKLLDGFHELRVVGVHADAIETRGRLVLPFVVNNGGAALEFNAQQLPPPVGPEAADGLGLVRIRARQPGATAIVIRQNGREIGRIEGDTGELDAPAATLGRGPITLQAFSEGPAPAASAPVGLQIR